MTTYTIFGYNNATGSYFRDLITNSTIEFWGRRDPQIQNSQFVYCDLLSLPCDTIYDLKGVLVSFAPIWLLAGFLSRVFEQEADRLKGLEGIIAISSSSFLTKQFAFSEHDKNLSKSLNEAHQSIIHICRDLNIKCKILAPTLVYGYKGSFRDRNVSQIIWIMRLLPFIFLPRSTGLRQPIHASQLASVAHKVSIDMIDGTFDMGESTVVTLGGDDIMDYSDMIARIQNSLPKSDSGRNCRLLEIPDRLFLLLVTILLPLNTKLFESIVRIKSDLAGFTRASDMIGGKPTKFPLLPLSL